MNGIALLPPLLASDFTLFHLLPWYRHFEETTTQSLGSTLVGGTHVSSLTHITLALLATTAVIVAAALTRAAWAASPNAVIPDGRVSVRNFVETVLDGMIGLGEQIMGSREAAERFLPLIGTLALYILFSNLLGLIPGFAPPTDNLNVTVGPALVVFFVTHVAGFRAQGVHYLMHFMGPKIGKFPWLFIIMLPIELISHVARPLSLSLRLMGNMVGDHRVMSIFLGLTAFSVIFPLPILVLGTLVCVVQTLVFCLLSMVYISLAIEHAEEDH